MKRFLSTVAALCLLVTSVNVSAYNFDDTISFKFDDEAVAESTGDVMEEIPFDEASLGETVADQTDLNGSLKPSVVMDVDDSNDDFWNVSETDADGNLIAFDESNDASQGLEATATVDIPSSYDSRDKGYLTSVKNQGSYGTCWAHSTCAAMESSMIKNGYEGTFIDYSETHLSYYCHAKDTLTGDGSKSYTSSYGYYGGGNPILALSFLEGGVGLAYESEYSYPPASKSAALPESDRRISHVSVNGAGRLYSGSDRNTKMKQAIMDHGGICIAYFEASAYLSTNNAYYQTVKSASGANHSVYVIGWDDNYAVENFRQDLTTPTGNGAWLVKGSYGEQNYDNGYMWLSYEDPSITDMCWFEAKPVNEDVTHSYNGACPRSFYKNYTANVFQITEDETLTAVGLNTYTGSNSPSETARVSVVVYDSKPSSPAASGYTYGKTYKLDVSRDGFYRAALPATVHVKAGQYVAIIQQTTNNYTGAVASHSIEYGTGFSSNEGETYIYLTLADKVKDSSGSYVTGWVDARNVPDDASATTKTYNTHNADMKLYAISDTSTVKFETRGGTTIESQTLAVGSTVTKPDDPTLDGYPFVGWYTNTTCTKAWNFDDAISSGMTLYAKYESPSGYQAIPWGRAFAYNSSGSTLIIGVIGKYIKKFDLVYYIGGSYYGRMADFTGDKVGSFLTGKATMPENKYMVAARVYGINGEVLESKRTYVELTTEPHVTINGPYLSVINMDTENLPMVMGYGLGDDGRFECATLDYSPATIEATSANYVIQVDNDEADYNYCMWDITTQEPVCITSDAFDDEIDAYVNGSGSVANTTAAFGVANILSTTSQGIINREENIIALTNLKLVPIMPRQ